MTSKVFQLQQLFSKGKELLQAGNFSGALSCFQAAITIDPSQTALHLHAGVAFHNLRCYGEAIAAYLRAISIAPDMAEAFNNLGNSLMELGRFSEAADSFSRASELMQSSPVPLTAQATALQALGKVTEAERCCLKALSLDPGFAAAHWNLALNLLLQGRYSEGWQEYEWRWQKPDFTSPCRHTDIPIWDGAPLEGRTILLHAEQGFGDAIQFARYVPLVAQFGGAVLIECHPPLVNLMQGIEGVKSVFPFGAPLPPFDCQAPLLSLPHIFGTTLETVPSQFPYISVSAEYRNKWAGLVSSYPSKLRVGLVWAGKSYPDPLRSCWLADLAPLATGKATFFSLQLGEGAAQTSSPPLGMQICDLTGQIQDFADTAALIEQLDLVISIDTAVAHLAGAMGRPVYLMLPFAPDWRWLLGRTDSPWYPTMRIFRQQHPGEWSEVIVRLQSALDKLSGASQTN